MLYPEETNQKHIHTYVQFKARKGYFRCAATDCPKDNHHLEREAVIGKRSRCPDCGTVFVLDNQDVKRVRPLCLNCSDTKKARAYRLGQSVLKDMTVFKEVRTND